MWPREYGRTLNVRLMTPPRPRPRAPTPNRASCASADSTSSSGSELIETVWLQTEEALLHPRDEGERSRIRNLRSPAGGEERRSKVLKSSPYPRERVHSQPARMGGPLPFRLLARLKSHPRPAAGDVFTDAAPVLPDPTSLGPPLRLERADEGVEVCSSQSGCVGAKQAAAGSEPCGERDVLAATPHDFSSLPTPTRRVYPSLSNMTLALDQLSESLADPDSSGDTTIRASAMSTPPRPRRRSSRLRLLPLSSPPPPVPALPAQPPTRPVTPPAVVLIHTPPRTSSLPRPRVAPMTPITAPATPSRLGKKRSARLLRLRSKSSLRTADSGSFINPKAGSATSSEDAQSRKSVTSTKTGSGSVKSSEFNPPSKRGSGQSRSRRFSLFETEWFRRSASSSASVAKSEAGSRASQDEEGWVARMFGSRPGTPSRNSSTPSRAATDSRAGSPSPLARPRSRPLSFASSRASSPFKMPSKLQPKPSSSPTPRLKLRTAPVPPPKSALRQKREESWCTACSARCAVHAPALQDPFANLSGAPVFSDAMARHNAALLDAPWRDARQSSQSSHPRQSSLSRQSSGSIASRAEEGQFGSVRTRTKSAAGTPTTSGFSVLVPDRSSSLGPASGRSAQEAHRRRSLSLAPRPAPRPEARPGSPATLRFRGYRAPDTIFESPHELEGSVAVADGHSPASASQWSHNADGARCASAASCDSVWSQPSALSDHETPITEGDEGGTTPTMHRARNGSAWTLRDTGGSSSEDEVSAWSD